MTVALGAGEMGRCLRDGVGFRVERGSGCLLWEQRAHTGYGPFLAAWEAVNGPVPEGQVPRHTCRGGPYGCVNPDHLQLVAAGRDPPPASAGVSLSGTERAAFARRIRDEREARSEARAAFARAVGVSASTIAAWEDEARSPTVDEVRRLSRALGWDGAPAKWTVVAAVERVVVAIGAGQAARLVRDSLNVDGHADKVVIGRVTRVE
jgi:DNA-binding XRE family transcriptional regulator